MLVHDLPAALQKSPLDAADRGDPDAWVLVMQNPQNATALQDLCNLVGSFGGRCGSQEVSGGCKNRGYSLLALLLPNSVPTKPRYNHAVTVPDFF